MGGFLEGLGQFAGGAAQGIKEGVEIGTRAQARRAAEFELQEKQDQAARDDMARQAVAARLGVTVDKPPAPKVEPGLMSRLGSLFSSHNMDDIKTASGLGTTTTQAATTPAPIGDAGGASAIPGAAPAPAAPAAPPPSPSALTAAAGAAPPPAAAPPAAAPSLGQVSTQTFSATQPGVTRPTTAIDNAYQEAQMYARAGKPDLAMQAFNRYQSMVAIRHAQAIPYMSESELSNMYGKVFGSPGKVTRNVSKDGDVTYDISRAETDDKGNTVYLPVQKGMTEGHLQQALVQELTPEQGVALANASDHDFATRVEARQKAAETAARVALQGAQTGQAVATTGETQADTRKKNADQVWDEGFRADTAKYSKPWAVVLNGQDALTYANSGFAHNKDGFVAHETTRDPTTGASVSSPYNPVLRRYQQEQDQWNANPTVHWGLVQIIHNGGPDGPKVFAVPNPDGNGYVEFGEDGGKALDYAKSQVAKGVYGGYKDPESAAQSLRYNMGQRTTLPGAKPGQPGGPRAAPAAAAAPPPGPNTPTMSWKEHIDTGRPYRPPINAAGTAIGGALQGVVAAGNARQLADLQRSLKIAQSNGDAAQARAIQRSIDTLQRAP
jgi:hypothetical protein